jgi:hypothetical protein
VIGIVAGGMGLGVGGSILVHRLVATDSFYSDYLRASGLWLAVAIMQVALFGGIQVWAALRRRDELRAALLWGVSLVFIAEGFTGGAAMDEILVWLLYAGLVGVVAAILATLEAPRRLRELLLAVVATGVLACSVWILDRLAPATG